MTNSLDSGAGSLRAAFAAASGAAGPQTVCVNSNVTGPIILTSGELVYSAAVTPGLTLEGNGIAVSGANLSRVIDNTTTGPLSLDRVTITSGAGAAGGGVNTGGSLTLNKSILISNTSSGNGGAVHADGDVSVTDSIIAYNTSDVDGGGIFNAGLKVTITNSTVSYNTGSQGGGIATAADVTVTSSTISNNTARIDGGGVNSFAGVVEFTDSALTGNSAITGGGVTGRNVTVVRTSVTGNTARGLSGGGINANALATVIDSTVANNAANNFGGGGVAASEAAVTNSTIANNSAGDNGGGGILVGGDLSVVYATIVQNAAPFGANIRAFDRGADNSLSAFGSVIALAGGGGANCSLEAGTISHGFNFSDDSTCALTAATDKQDAGDPKLGALADNGGPGLTLLPQLGSPLIDAIPAAACQSDGAAGITSDERGVTRPQGSGCDIGAVEVELVVRFTG